MGDLAIRVEEALKKFKTDDFEPEELLSDEAGYFIDKGGDEHTREYEIKLTVVARTRWYEARVKLYAIGDKREIFPIRSIEVRDRVKRPIHFEEPYSFSDHLIGSYLMSEATGRAICADYWGHRDPNDRYILPHPFSISEIKERVDDFQSSIKDQKAMATQQRSTARQSSHHK
jgi:hypothetical protein